MNPNEQEYDNLQDNIPSEEYNDFHDYAMNPENEGKFDLEDETREIFPNDYDTFVMEEDFSEIGGKNYRSRFSKIRKKAMRKGIDGRRPIKRRRLGKPLSKSHGIRRKGTIHGGQKKMSKIIVPDDKKVIVEGANNFILSRSRTSDSIKNIGYWKGKKLTPLILTINNAGAVPFVMEFFNPSAPLDYLQSTGLNINNQVQVAGGIVSYTDVLFSLLANPAIVPNCQFVFAGPSIVQQRSIPLQFRDKEISGTEALSPLTLGNEIDTMQVLGDIVYFDMTNVLNRPYIPDGMDVLGYTILPGMTVVMCFYYKQVALKKVFYPEARVKRIKRKRKI